MSHCQALTERAPTTYPPFSRYTGAQLLLFQWKKLHMKSYNVVTLFGLWAFPGYIAFSLMFERMMLVWSFFTLGE